MKYTDETFDQLIAKSYSYDTIACSSSEWKVARQLYRRNYVNTDGETRIPKIIHQIWLGGKLPEKYLPLVLTWQNVHPTWIHQLWTDEDIRTLELSPRIQHAFDTCTNIGMKADIIRYHILDIFGGLYVDTDFECLKPFDDLRYLEFFTGIAYDRDFTLYNGLIATVPKHPIIKSCLNVGAYSGNNPTKIMEATGPYHLTKCFNKNAFIDTKGVVAFPMDFFYPLPNNKRREEDTKKYIKPVSYGIHYWDVSWLK
jgi:inositol phosphorylceramide mannosyltransferase catalytic subunit